MLEGNLSLNNVNRVIDKAYELILDEKGKAVIDTDLLVGELRLIKFKLLGNAIDKDTMTFSPFTVKIYMDGKKILNEVIDTDEFYVLKVQSRDGFNQFFSMDSEFYLLNDVLRVEVSSGIPDASVLVTFRLKGD
jgi:hypothetical protein